MKETNDEYSSMPVTASPLHNYHFLKGGGEMGELIRSIDWAQTPLGPVKSWPASLKLTTSIILSSPFPMYIAWGPEYIQLYNDGYRPILGSTKHPQALGISTCETFREIYNTVGPLFDGVMNGKAVLFENFMYPLDRNGYIEECYFDFSYSPIYNDDGTAGGVLVTVVETTEKLKAFNDLQKSRQELELSKAEVQRQRDRLKGFFMQAPAGICILDGQDLVFELVNPSYQQLFPGRDLLGKPLLKAVPEIKNQSIWDILQGVYQTGETFEGSEVLIPIASNVTSLVEERYFNFIYQARRNATGDVDGILVFVFEVTEMVQAKRQIEESERRFRNMIEQAPVALMVNKGEDLIFEEINQPMIDLIGKGVSVKGKPWYEAIPELKGQPIIDRLLHTFRSGEEWKGYEQPIVLNKNGNAEQYYYNLAYKPLIENGKITGVLQSAIEVTEQVKSRKELEQARDTLKLAITAAELGMFDMDLEEGTMYWDRRCRTLFGINHNETVTYEKDFVNGLHPDDRDRVTSLINNVFIKSISNGDYDVEYRTIGVDDQKLRWVRAKGKTYFDEHDKPLRFIGAVLEITEQKLDELRKNDFIGMVSHELKTPLTSLNAYAQVLYAKAIKDNEKFRIDLLGKVLKQIKKMSSMINGFLNVSQLESGKIHLNTKDFNLDELVNDMVEEAEFSFPSHTFILTPCQSCPVHADPDKIGSVIFNLLSNAVKYSPKGKSIEVKCDLADNMAQVSVTDEGMGIKPEDINRLFDRYYRVESKHTQAISGFGIGLYLSAEIINRHDGKIWAESELGKGSAFWFTLPLNN
jgi:two-component system sensor histidine kinase VicK